MTAPIRAKNQAISPIKPRVGRIALSTVLDVVRVSGLVDGADEAVADADALEVEVRDPLGVVLAILEVDVRQGDDVRSAVGLAESVKLGKSIRASKPRCSPKLIE